MAAIATMQNHCAGAATKQWRQNSAIGGNIEGTVRENGGGSHKKIKLPPPPPIVTA
jgi:hypothetical protein